MLDLFPDFDELLPPDLAPPLRRNGPLIAGLSGAAWMFLGLTSPAPFGTIAALSGAVLVVTVIAWDWSLQRRCER